MNKRGKTFLQMAKRVAEPLEVEFSKPPRGSYSVRVLRAREGVTLEHSALSFGSFSIVVAIGR